MASSLSWIDAMSEAALVLFSGGQDSTTCLAWALDRYERVETIGFNYGQRHSVEMECRQDLLAAIRSQFPQWAARLGSDLVVDVPTLGTISETSLTREAEFRLQADGLPNSFVPGRNLVFLTFAAAVAYRRDIKRIVTGVCETDYSGYPDCRDDTMKAMQVALSLGLERRLVIETPLMWVDKLRTWHLAESLGGPVIRPATNRV
jgi:7-cyano-7-deazaguanine synthase